MSSINSFKKSNAANLETQNREMTGYAPPPPPPPPQALYNGGDYRSTQGLESLGRGHGGLPEAGLEDIDLLIEEEFVGWVEETPAEEVPVEAVAEETETESPVQESEEATPPPASGPSEEEKKEFSAEIRQAKADFAENVEGNENLSEAQKQEFIQKFNERADALGVSSDLDAARETLSELPEVLNLEIKAAVEAAEQARQAERQTLFTEIGRVTQDPSFRHDGGHWRHVGWALGEKFDTALQSGEWSAFNTAVAGLSDGDQRFVPIMRLVSAIYRSAGRDETKAFEMINNFIPKETVLALINKVTEAAENLNWRGQGWPDDQNQVGDDKWHQWTPSETAAFLRRSLEVRREDDPYAPIGPSSSTEA